MLWLLDGFFDIINKIWRYKFFNNEFVDKIFGGAILVACSWLVLKVLIELIMNYIVKNDGRSNPLTIYKGIILAIVMMFLVNPLFQFGYNVSTKMTDAVIKVSNADNGDSMENTISKALIRAMAFDHEMDADDKEYLVNNWKTVNINKTAGGFAGISDYYKYSLNFFMLIILSIVTIFLLFFIAIQMSKRVMELALYKILAPFCCTSLTSNSPKSFETWCKNTLGLFLITVVQFVCIGLLLSMFASAFTDNGLLTGIFLIIGSLLFIIGTPTLVSTLLGQQSGIMSAFGDMQSMIAIGSGVNAGLSLARAGSMAVLGKGASVIKKGGNSISGGLKNMFKNNVLNTEQMSELKEKLENHNNYSAGQFVKNAISENKKIDTRSSLNNVNQMIKPFNMNYNPIRNQYLSQSKLNSNSNLGGKKN